MSHIRKIANLMRRVIRYLLQDIENTTLTGVKSMLDINIGLLKEEIRRKNPQALVLHGFKAYSQCDEDGIIKRIFHIIGEKDRIFFEAGCGRGIENNTHYLLLQGWRGAWLDGDADNIQFIRSQLQYFPNPILSVSREFITAENINALVENGLRAIGVTDFPRAIDFLSLDIDGNDLYVADALQVVRPRVISLEYNAKFRPPVEIAIAYRASHEYLADDYQGASLQSLVSTMMRKGYRLVACSLSGVNAFFVDASEAGLLPADTVENLYQPPRHYLTTLAHGHASSLKFIKDVLAGASKQ